MEQAKILFIVLFSLKVTTISTVLATLLGAPLGAITPSLPSRLRKPLVVVCDSLTGIPSVLVGLLLYLLLAGSGPLGSLQLIFTPTAIVLAQTTLMTPLICTMTRQVVEPIWRDYQEQLAPLGVTRFGQLLAVMMDTRDQFFTTVLTAFGRGLSEVGAALIVGGNITNQTQTLTTAIASETGKGNIDFSITLGVALLALTFLINLLSRLALWRRS